MDKDEIFDPGVDVAYQLETSDDARDLYAKWAQTYEAGFISTTKYVYHDGVARVFVDRARSDRGPVLDVGCGSAGTFTHGHVGPDALDELIRVATPGCQFALGINTQVYEPEGFGDRFAAEVAAGTITAFGLVDIAMYDRTEGEHAGDRAQVAMFVKSH